MSPGPWKTKNRGNLIDYVLAATQAEKTVGGDELGLLGIAFDKVTRSPPNRVLDDLERAAVASDLIR